MSRISYAEIAKYYHDVLTLSVQVEGKSEAVFYSNKSNETLAADFVRSNGKAYRLCDTEAGAVLTKAWEARRFPDEVLNSADGNASQRFAEGAGKTVHIFGENAAADRILRNVEVAALASNGRTDEVVYHTADGNLALTPQQLQKQDAVDSVHSFFVPRDQLNAQEVLMSVVEVQSAAERVSLSEAALADAKAREESAAEALKQAELKAEQDKEKARDELARREAALDDARTTALQKDEARLKEDADAAKRNETEEATRARERETEESTLEGEKKRTDEETAQRQRESEESERTRQREASQEKEEEAQKKDAERQKQSEAEVTSRAHQKEREETSEAGKQSQERDTIKQQREADESTARENERRSEASEAINNEKDSVRDRSTADAKASPEADEKSAPPKTIEQLEAERDDAHQKLDAVTTKANENVEAARETVIAAAEARLQAQDNVNASRAELSESEATQDALIKRLDEDDLTPVSPTASATQASVRGDKAAETESPDVGAATVRAEEATPEGTDLASTGTVPSDEAHAAETDPDTVAAVVEQAALEEEQVAAAEAEEAHRLAAQSQSDTDRQSKPDSSENSGEAKSSSAEVESGMSKYEERVYETIEEAIAVELGTSFGQPGI